MKQTRAIAITLFVVFGACAANARESKSHITKSKSATALSTRAAPCTPATHRANLDFNNVRALIETGGSMWQDRAVRTPAYEVPRTNDNSGPSAIFAGSLWMGGVSPDNQLKLAAVRFREGNDYWPGPLTTDGAATVDGEVCIEYDRTWGALLADAELHNAFNLCRVDPTCDDAVEFPDYITPAYFFEWPAHGNVDLGQDFMLAPFNDFDLSGDYNPASGDFPGFDIDGIIDCKTRSRDDAIPLFGDTTIWWVFNDRGNAHTESGGQPIGMEIRAQAFAFSTNDQINNMTFYNYTLINQGTQTLLNTYFGQWVDVDLGNAQDDYVGCDVRRGLGYAYNGDNNDESGTFPGYGVQPPAIGVDFFEGPFQDADGIDNPLTLDVQAAIDSAGIPYEGIGIGYGDGVPDNERFGMRAFLYHNNTGPSDPDPRGDPRTAIQYYNYLQGIWRDNSVNLFGGTGHMSSSAERDRPAFYMFPGDSDPVFWGTSGLPTDFEWTEEQAMNNEGDRRFIQSAGPFTLEPGAFNNITVGVVWARASGGGPFESVNEVRQADDRAQSLFDNCFRILDGPDAPVLTAQELDREVILYLTNPSNSNNNNEAYEEFDPTIPEFSVVDGDTTILDRFYHFQGYQVYQLADEGVSVSDIDDVDKARLVYQGDIRDSNSQLINFINNQQLGLAVPTEMVDGENEGLVHAIRVTEDLFAQTGDPNLVNFRTYHFLAVAYGVNTYEEYNPSLNSGQALPYLRGRKSPLGEIRSISAIPHNPSSEAGGTVQGAQYGDGFEVTRLEGQGNGGLEVAMKREDILSIATNPPHFNPTVTYEAGMGPVDIRVVDPLNVPAGMFEIGLRRDSINPNDISDAHWFLVNMATLDTVFSEQSIRVANEQLLIGGAGGNLGLSVNIENHIFEEIEFLDDGGILRRRDLAEPIGQGMIEHIDPDQMWYTGIPDQDGETMFNWIRSGTATGGLYDDYLSVDNDEAFESYAGGMWAPWALVGDTGLQPGALSLAGTITTSRTTDLPSVEVVMTPDEDLWTRCVVLEIAEFGSEHGDLKLGIRSDQSVDKNGNPDGTGIGMGWFPGYAVNLETGERLNMAFGEDSFLGGTTGRDMIWNPSDSLTIGPLETPILGGGHWIYVFNNRQRLTGRSNRVPMYDEGAFIANSLMGSNSQRTEVFRAMSWVGSALLIEGATLLSSEVRVRLNVARPYLELQSMPHSTYPEEISIASEALNGGLPLYRFSTGTAITETNVRSAAQEACDLMNVVPNPYYAWSRYETGRLDNRVKFTNLPEQATISIYNVSGTLVRQYKKDNDLTFLDWDLKNQRNVPIAGGLYIIHIDAPGVCERVIKWFGALRPTDLQNF